jgi:hypothetical protein
MTADLAEFIKARLDTAEAHARKDIWAADQATPGKWEALYGANLRRSQIQVGDMAIAVVASPQHEADVLLMARFKPDTVRKRAERMLREVEAKRRLLVLALALIEQEGSSPAADLMMRQAGEEILQQLALPYDREEWRP